MKNKKLDYASAGVDIAAADRAKEKIKLLARETFNESVLSEIGSFGGFFRPNLTGLKEPVLVSSADGVGTKLKVAFMSGRHDTVGGDIVNHCINDILVHGARPLFFMDYIATGKLNPEIVAEIVKGLSAACRQAGMALIGGETAEMPDMYAPGEYDLAGFIVGIVDRHRIINGTAIREGDILIGLGSNGLHTNGYSLARKAIFDVGGKQHHDYVDELEMKVADALLLTHRSYLKPIMSLLDKFDIRGMAHITGGGISGNLIRVIPENLGALVRIGNWNVPRIFEFIRDIGKISEIDMFQAFNMGIGYIIVLPSIQVESAMESLREMGEAPYKIGEIVSGKHEVKLKD